MLPEPLPTLKGKCAREFVKELVKPPTQKDIEIFEEATKVFRTIKQASNTLN